MIVKETIKEETQIVKLTIYTCSDGKTFREKDEAEDYEKYLDAKEIVKNLNCRKDNFVGFEKYYDVAYYCSSKEEFDAVCIVIKNEDINLQYEEDDCYIQYEFEKYKDKGWYYFKVSKDYCGDYEYNWRLEIGSLNMKRNFLQESFDKVKRELDTFNEMYSKYF